MLVYTRITHSRQCRNYLMYNGRLWKEGASSVMPARLKEIQMSAAPWECDSDWDWVSLPSFMNTLDNILKQISLRAPLLGAATRHDPRPTVRLLREFRDDTCDCKVACWMFLCSRNCYSSCCRQTFRTDRQCPWFCDHWPTVWKQATNISSTARSTRTRQCLFNLVW